MTSPIGLWVTVLKPQVWHFSRRHLVCFGDRSVFYYGTIIKNAQFSQWPQVLPTILNTKVSTLLVAATAVFFLQYKKEKLFSGEMTLFQALFQGLFMFTNGIHTLLVVYGRNIEYSTITPVFTAAGCTRWCNFGDFFFLKEKHGF